MENIGGRKSDTRIEIAVLQENASSKNDKLWKFTIPSIINGDESTITTSTSNLKNKTNNKKSKVNMKNTIELSIPYHLKIFFSSDKIPKGTRFLVELSYDYIADARIIGLYDAETIKKYEWNYIQLERKVKSLIGAVKLLQKFNGIEQDWGD